MTRILTLGWTTSTDASECRCIWRVHFAPDSIVCHGIMLSDQALKWTEDVIDYLWHPKPRIDRTWLRWRGPKIPVRSIEMHGLIEYHSRNTEGRHPGLQTRIIRSGPTSQWSVPMSYTASKMVSSIRSRTVIPRETAHSRLLLAHQSVNKKKTASTKLATLLALVSKPQVIKQAPIKEDPRYPCQNHRRSAKDPETRRLMLPPVMLAKVFHLTCLLLLLHQLASVPMVLI